MKKRLKNKSLSILLLLPVFLLQACGSSSRKEQRSTVTEYTCPMHPRIVRDKPGDCPICGMQLVERTKKVVPVQVPAALSDLLESPDRLVISDIALVRPQVRTLRENLEFPGVITYDPRNLYSIASRYSGRIEKLYLRYEFQKVHKGEKIAEIYSPELVSAQRDLLYIFQSDPENKPLIAAARKKLMLLGVTPVQIGRIIRSGEARYAFPVYSPYSGYLLRAGTSPSASPAVPGGSALLLNEGAYVTTGETMFKIADLSSLRAEINFPAGKARGIKEGTRVRLITSANDTINARISLIQPFYSGGETFSKARIDIPGGKGLIAGQLITAVIIYEAKNMLSVPATAVADLGTRKAVFVKEGNTLRARAIQTGVETDDYIEVKSGISPQDQVAANARLLTDSQSFIDPDQHEKNHHL